MPDSLPAVSVTDDTTDATVDDAASAGDTTTTTSVEELWVDPDDYLLQAEDLPGWTYVRRMDFGAEPTFDTPECGSMQTAWGAHAAAGSRIRASHGEVSFRQTVVEMPDEESAVAIIDAASEVWKECNPLATASGTEWWVEPIETIEIDGWRTAGLALGESDGLIWSITWIQKGTTVIYIDLDSENPWDEVGRVQQAVAARINGQPDPTLMEPAATTTTEPGNGTEPSDPGTRPTITLPQDPLPLPVDPPPTTEYRPEWKDHPAASYIVDPEFFGSGFEMGYVRVEEAEPSDPEDLIDGCPAVAPPTMDGLSPTYEHESGTAEIGVVIGIDNAQWAQDTVDSMRSVAKCDTESLAIDTIKSIDPKTDADDAVFLDMTFDGNTMFLLVARYDDRLIGLVFASEDGSEVPTPSVATFTRWASEIAALG